MEVPWERKGSGQYGRKMKRLHEALCTSQLPWAGTWWVLWMGTQKCYNEDIEMAIKYLHD